MDIKLEKEDFQCPMCNKNFKIKTKFNKHVNTHFAINCDKCNINFKTRHQKRLHDRSSHPQKKYMTCRICPEVSFKTEEEYLLHIRDVHRGKLIDCYMCNMCGKTFKTRSELRQHINSKCGTEKLFTCKNCGKKLMSQGSLYNHMRRHSDVANFMCGFCAKLFHTAGQLKVHERIHTQQKDFICDVCGKGFCHRQSLITHSTVHTGIKPFQCEGCGKSFSCVGNLLKHRRAHSDTCGLLPLTTHRVKNPSTRIKVKINTPASSKLKEGRRNKEFQEKLAKLDMLLKTDIKTVDTAEIIKKVEEQNVASKNIESLKIENHGVVEQSYCSNTEEYKYDDNSDEVDDDLKADSEICLEKLDINKETIDPADDLPKQSTFRTKHGKKTKRKRDRLLDQKLKDFKRERMLDSGKTASCKYCNKEYTHFRSLYRHEQEHDENGEHKNLPFRCSCCRKSFEKKDDLKDHQQLTHSDILSCHDCGDKIFATIDSLRSHKYIYHKGAPRKNYVYVCEKCGKKFKQKPVFQLHMEMGCGDGPLFKCYVCQKEFSNNYTRKAHMRVHNPEKTLVCKFCGKRFRWKGQLKVHERSHTGEKPYTCLFCPSAFAYRDSLITHSTLHTGIKPYFCKGCGWRFSCIGNLLKHKTAHASTCGMWYQMHAKEDS